MVEIRLENITKIYGVGASAVAAADDVTLHIRAGELYFLLGPSGCGKTTLLRIVAGLIEPTKGRVFFGERDVTRLAVEKRNTAMVFQSYALWPHMTVGRNVAFGPKMQRVGASRRRELARVNLQRVRMEEFESRRPNQLSGGQQQRVALARALAAQPACLLLDEPLSNLDARLRQHMRGELRRLVKSTGTTAIYVTHDQKEALAMADRIAVMNEGRVVQVAGPRELYNRPATRFVADFLGEANFIEGRVAAAGPPARIDTPVGTILSSADCPPIGAKVTCCIRPERIVVAGRSPQTRPDASSFPAVIGEVTYLGEIAQYTCRVAGKAEWKLTVLAELEPLAEGQEVTLSVAPEDVAVLER